MKPCTLSTGKARAPKLLFVIFPLMPILNLGFQFCAEKVAQATAGVPFGAAWLIKGITQPWVVLIAALEVASFAIWMTILSRFSVSAAFPLTAISYCLVIALGWFGFHEPVRPMEVAGAVLIVAGVFIIGGDDEAAK